LKASPAAATPKLFNVISLEFHQLVMAAAGFQAEQRKQQAAKAYAGRYILVVEGSIPLGQGGIFATTGASGTTFLEEITQLSAGAAAVIAVGACATSAALPAANPDPTGAVSVADVVKGKPVINIPACPMNPANFVGTLLHYTLTGTVPELDGLLRPKFAFGLRIHDNCERRAHFDAGEYVSQWGDAAAQNNFCLYKMGCKGPMTYNNCSIIRYNEATSWPIGAGHGCIGCSEPAFWDLYATERPMLNANVNFPGVFGWGVEGSVDKIGVGLLAATGVGIAAHATASAVANYRANRVAAAAAAPAGQPPSAAPPPEERPDGDPPAPLTPDRTD
jgi:quinone-reactive Ni/Fe-hydrogenase small subunit